eukprot:7306625-Alexandrium_andersonii.AAC.1
MSSGVRATSAVACHSLPTDKASNKRVPFLVAVRSDVTACTGPFIVKKPLLSRGLGVRAVRR